MVTQQHSSGTVWQAKLNGLENLIRSNELQFHKLCQEQSDNVDIRTRELSVAAADDKYVLVCIVFELLH